MRKLRLLALLAAFVALIWPRATPAEQGPAVIHLSADRIVFYFDRYIIEADGNVRARMSDGTLITGDTFSMDLKLNRFLIASNVRLQSPGGNIAGAAIADFLEQHRVYFIPVIEKPDRWTYENGDYKTPLKGRLMPGDTFYFPDLTNSPQFLIARSAVIGEKTFVRFQNVVTRGAVLPIPVPSQYFYFGTNRDLAQNSLAGANVDLAYNAFGNANSESAFHVRKDQQSGVYGSFEQHLAWSRGYAVFSVNPGTKRDKFWSLLTENRIGKRFQIDTYTQLFTRQQFLEQPTAAATWTYVTATQAFNQSYLQAFANFTNYNVLGPGTYGGSLNHPFHLQLTASSFTHRIGKTPFYESTSYGMGYDSDNINGLQNFGGVQYNQIWNHTLGGTLYMPGVKIGNHENTYKTYLLNATYSKNYTWHSVPHWNIYDHTSISLGRQFVRQFNAYVQYDVDHTGDYYRVGNGYAPAPPPAPQPTPPVIDGNPVPSILAFRGVATQRTATIGGIYSASPNLVAAISYAHHDDFPIPYPGLFTEPPLNNLGQPQYQNYLGQPPDHITGEIRALVVPHIVLDISRGYFFNFGNDRWTPQFSVQVVGQ